MHASIRWCSVVVLNPFFIPCTPLTVIYRYIPPLRNLVCKEHFYVSTSRGNKLFTSDKLNYITLKKNPKYKIPPWSGIPLVENPGVVKKTASQGRKFNGKDIDAAFDHEQKNAGLLTFAVSVCSSVVQLSLVRHVFT